MADAECRCGLPVGESIAVVDGERGGRWDEADAARSRACPHCRRRIAASRRIGEVLREATPLRDDPVGRAVVRARLETARGNGWSVSRRQFPAVAAAGLLGLAAVLRGREGPGSDEGPAPTGVDGGDGGGAIASRRRPAPLSAGRIGRPTRAEWEAARRAEQAARARWERRRRIPRQPFDPWRRAGWELARGGAGFGTGGVGIGGRP